MPRQRHILIIGNYLPDGEESMIRYAAILAQHLPALNLKVSFLFPSVVAGRWASGSAVLAKFLGHFDKLVLFPFQLRRFLARADRERPVDLVHICDNCNSFYIRTVKRHHPSLLAVVTCHDFFALNGTLGLQPGVKPRFTGRLLQRYVWRGLRHADHLLCVSHATAENLSQLPGYAQTPFTVIANGLAEGFSALPENETEKIVGAMHPALCARPRGFVFHVGNNLWYKNRELVLDAYFETCRRMQDPPLLVLAGKKLNPNLATIAALAPAKARVIELGRINDQQLAALYRHASCLLFPSLNEGFGWPILEAMACHCPVITSARAPMAEIAGGAAYLIDPTNITQAAEAIEQVLEMSSVERKHMITAGLNRAALFSIERMIREVGQLYGNLLEQPHQVRKERKPLGSAI